MSGTLLCAIALTNVHLTTSPCYPTHGCSRASLRFHSNATDITGSND